MFRLGGTGAPMMMDEARVERVREKVQESAAVAD